ncbi:MAG TPA: hypothetical protein VMC81_07970 [Rhodocyclaceae bacterium]|nr:hypothetical protein [Rhodocyclaceae bacterium]
MIFRHAEKPPSGLGQLTCQGLNRALALPRVLTRLFGKPESIYAPDPSVEITEGPLNHYSYVRPLATVEPTAIRLEMPINTQYGFKDIDGLIAEITSRPFSDQVVFVAWEHVYAHKLTIRLLRKYGGDTSGVPAWPGDDFDTLNVVTISGGKATYKHLAEGLNGQPAACPETP